MPTSPSNYQPILVLNQDVELSGVYPNRDVFNGMTLGMVRTYAFNFYVGGTADGHTISLSQNTALFSLLGTNYGGDGRTTFALPNLVGRVTVGEGEGPGLYDYVLGEMTGDTSFTVNNNNLPPSRGGFSVPVNDIQPVTAVHFMIQTVGTYNAGLMTDIGRVVEFAAGFTPEDGYMECNGQILLISQYEALYTLIGTTYGGDGLNTFALPDLRGRTIIGTGADTTGHTYVLGENVGQQEVTLNVNQLPSALGGSSQPIDNHEPSLALNYMIALTGIFPSRDYTGGDYEEPFLGEIVASASNQVPNGYALCNGQILQINQNQALFALLGTQYGGNGVTTFALPDLRGRAVVNQGNGFTMGQKLGTASITLSNTDVVNPPPTATGGSAVTNQNAAVSGQLVGADPYNQPITYSVVSDGAHGHVVISANGSYTYTPTTGYAGPDSFTFHTSDGASFSSTATMSITINSNNQTPVGNPGTGTVNEDNTLNGSVSANDPEGMPLTYAKASNPGHGTVTVNSNGSYAYTPDANYNGPDSFTFTANDGTNTSTPVTVNITVNAVNDAPTLTGVKATLAHGTEDIGYVVSKASLLQGYSDVDGDSLSVTGLSANHGSVTDNGNGTYTITPAANYNGAMGLSYTVSDGHGGSVAATQSYVVDAVNDAPTGTPTAVLPNGTEDQTYQINVSGLLNGFSDADGDTMAATNFVIDHGTLAGFSIPYFSITPEANYNGLVTVNYDVTDFHGGVTHAVQTFTLNPVNDAPTATPSSISTTEDNSVFGSMSGSDPDGDSLTYIMTGQPSHGTMSVGPDGSYTYTPNANYHGQDSFTFIASDGKVSSAPATVTITVNPVNDAPTGNSPAPVITNEDTPVFGTVSGSDIDGDTLTFAQGAGPGHGTLDFHSDGTYTYTPYANFNGMDTFTFTASDGMATSGPVIVTITVNPVNDPPALTGPQATLSHGMEDVSYVVTRASLLQGFTDVDGDTLTITGVAADHGTVTDNGDGTYTIAPEANYNGTMQLGYTVQDSQGASASGSLTYVVDPDSDIPVGDASSNATLEDTAVHGVLSAHDTDGKPLTFGAYDLPTHGSVVVDPDGNYLYTPAANYYGSDSFTFRVSNGSNFSAPVTVTLNVTSVNDVPVPNAPAPVLTNEDTPAASSVSASDADGDALTYAVSVGPAHGTVDFHTDGTYTYTPALDYSGPDSFSFTASDGTATSGPATVTINVLPVNDAPTGVDDTATVLAGGPRTITLTAPALLANDGDVDGDALSITGVGVAGHGTVSFSNNGTSTPTDDTITYTPTTGYAGTDSFSYTLSDGHGGSATATVNVTVQAATATTIYTAGGSGDDTIDKSAETISQLIAGNAGNDTLTGGTANDTLNGGTGNDILHGGKGADTLTGGAGADQFFIAKGDMASGVDKIVDFEGAGNGDVAGDDKILLEGFNAGATVTQISVAGNAHTYRVTDGGFTGTFIAVYSGSAVLQAGDYVFTPPPAVTYHSPVAGGDLATVLATGPRTITLSATTLMANDSDADGDAIAIVGVTAAGHGTVTFSDNGTATTADDYVTYTPTSGYAGLDTFAYILSDGTTTSNGTVSVTVQAETVSGPTYTSGTAGNDTYNFAAATATQTVAGNGGNDTITTGSAADTINGGAGDDVINGGGGKDTLTGGTGADTFVFTSADGDKIVDFSVADDTIALSKAVFGAITEQNNVDHILTAAEFVIGAAATNASQHVIYNASTGALWYDADGNGAGAAVQIALLSKNLTLTHDDFVVWP